MQNLTANNKLGYAAALAGIGAVTLLLRLVNSEHVNATTVSLALLLVVLLVATGWGRRPAIVAALLGGFCFNFFFCRPLARSRLTILIIG
jgi:K+-sensing histidine kinase KdpD